MLLWPTWENWTPKIYRPSQSLRNKQEPYCLKEKRKATKPADFGNLLLRRMAKIRRVFENAPNVEIFYSAALESDSSFY